MQFSKVAFLGFTLWLLSCENNAHPSQRNDFGERVPLEQFFAQDYAVLENDATTGQLLDSALRLPLHLLPSVIAIAFMTRLSDAELSRVEFQGPVCSFDLLPLDVDKSLVESVAMYCFHHIALFSPSIVFRNLSLVGGHFGLGDHYEAQQQQLASLHV